jgi:hypothetical protein
VLGRLRKWPQWVAGRKVCVGNRLSEWMKTFVHKLHYYAMDLCKSARVRVKVDSVLIRNMLKRKQTRTRKGEGR